MVLISILIIISAIIAPSLRITAIYFNRIAIILLLYSAVLAYNTLYTGLVSSGVGVFDGLFQVTTITQSMDIFMYLIGALVLLLGENSTLISKGKELPVLVEYPLIVLFTILGMSSLISSTDLVSMFLSIELQSFAVYILATIYRESESATSAGLTYFIIGSLSSALILLGSSLLYTFTGLTSFEGLSMLYSTISSNYYIEFGILLMVIGLLFKVSAAPFHLPYPSIYSGVPTVVMALLTTLPKLSVIIFLVEFQQIFQLSVNFNEIFLISGLLSVVLGSLAALSQQSIKKLLAYSSISNVGFLLLALSTQSSLGLEAFFFYFIQYLITNINVFFLLIAMGNVLYSPVSIYSPLTFISQMKGLFLQYPLLSFSFAISLFSLAGIPPLIGFFAKFKVLFSLISSGFYFVAIIIILFSVLSAFYYLRIIQIIHFDSFVTKVNSNSDNQINTVFSITIACITLLLVLFILNPSPLLNSIHQLTLTLYFV